MCFSTHVQHNCDNKTLTHPFPFHSLERSPTPDSLAREMSPNSCWTLPLGRLDFCKSSVGICPCQHSKDFSNHCKMVDTDGLLALLLLQPVLRSCAYYQIYGGKDSFHILWHMVLQPTIPTGALLFVDLSLISFFKRGTKRRKSCHHDANI